MSVSQQQGVAIVTGSAQGIGEAIALRLADDGYDLALNDIPAKCEALQSVAEQVRKKGRRVIIFVGDVSVEEDVKQLVGSTVENLGSIDVMVANAGIFESDPLLETTVDKFDKIFAINVRGTYLCFRYAAEQMVKQGRGGRLLGASSVVGVTGAAFVSLYGATKWAIRGLVVSLAKEFGKHGITVNAYAPGIIHTTPMWATAREQLARSANVPDQSLVDEAEKEAAAVGYLGVPEDVANLVSFIVKKESHFITGQTMSVNGGRFVH
jgi:NAD(P)-dependent dehydrogenase (short-subunit alcohol dehydrogenase family)